MVLTEFILCIFQRFAAQTVDILLGQWPLGERAAPTLWQVFLMYDDIEKVGVTWPNKDENTESNSKPFLAAKIQLYMF